MVFSVYTGYEGNGPISRVLDPMGGPPMSLLQHSISIFQEAPLKHQEKSNVLVHTCWHTPVIPALRTRKQELDLVYS